MRTDGGGKMNGQRRRRAADLRFHTKVNGEEGTGGADKATQGQGGRSRSRLIRGSNRNNLVLQMENRHDLSRAFVLSVHVLQGSPSIQYMFCMRYGTESETWITSGRPTLLYCT